MQEPILKLRQMLRIWGKQNIKNYPWRYRSDAYGVLVAEFMLHRTQVIQVEKIYRQFMTRYPTLEEYAAAKPEEVRQILQPLGLYWRIEAMVHALNELWEAYHAVPVDLKILISVSGIGDYIAGATYCFTLNKPIALVDTNTVRVVGRLLGLNISGEAREEGLLLGLLKKPVILSSQEISIMP